MQYFIQEIAYDQIKPHWQQLWPDREFEAVSAMSYLGGYQCYPPKHSCYYAVTDQKGQILGVNSCHDTGEYLVRSRGLWVDPSQRGQGLGKMLLEYTLTWAQQQGYIAVWSFPKLAAWPTYQSVGFVHQGPWIEQSGSTNGYALRFLNDDTN